MLNFFDTLIEYIQIIWSFFLNMITGLFTAFTTLFSSVSNATMIAGHMPWFISSSFFIVIFIVIINYIIGRSNQ